MLIKHVLVLTPGFGVFQLKRVCCNMFHVVYCGVKRLVLNDSGVRW